MTKMREVLLIIVMAGVGMSCSSKYVSISKKKWELKYHDSLVKDTIELNNIRFSFRKRNLKTLDFHSNNKFDYSYQNYPFYNKSQYMICGTDELEINQESTYYNVSGDTLFIKFKGSEFSTPDCCKYDIDKAFKIQFINKKTVRLIRIKDFMGDSQ